MKEEEQVIKEFYQEIRQPHRQFLMEKIENFSPLSEILEIGCGCGQNLYLLTERFPQAKIRGIDINPRVVQRGQELFKKEGMQYVKLSEGKADELGQFPDKSIDIVFTDAVLIYIGPDKIKTVIKEMTRIAKKALIFAEWHCQSPKDNDPDGLGVYYSGYWIRNYLDLLRKFVPQDKIRLSKIPEPIWRGKDWVKLGYIIEAKL
jgi:ubiquinone/menaquinone biosynthesis C-methylase UbiE